MTDVETTPTQDTPAATTATPDATAGTATAAPAPSVPATPEAAAWSPNFKFKYMGDKEEKMEGELEEWLRPMVNKDNNDKLLQFASKAYGLDFVKGKLNKTREEYQSYRGKTEPMLKTWDRLSAMYNNGDLRSFFSELKIPKDRIYQYVLDELNYQQLPQDQRQHMDQFNQYRQRAMELEEQNKTLQAQYEEMQQRQLDESLKAAISRPEVAEVAKSFNERRGDPNAFLREVAIRGSIAYEQTGQFIPPEKAVEEVMALLGTTQPTPPVVPSVIPVEQSTDKPKTIPNLQGKTATPIKKSFKSLDEMRKAAQAE